MAPKKGYRMAYCQCTSRRCGEVEYVDEHGQVKNGNKIIQHLARTHQLEDERNRSRVTASIDEDNFQRAHTSNSHPSPLDALIERIRLSSMMNPHDHSQSLHQNTEQASTSNNPTEQPEGDQSDPNVPVFDTSKVFYIYVLL